MNLTNTPIIPDVTDMDREEAERVIRGLYGIDSYLGRQLILAVIEEMGELSTFTDEAVVTLAEKHLDEKRKTVLGD